MFLKYATAKGRAMRAVTLIASATEIVCALGCRDQLVGPLARVRFPAGCARPAQPDRAEVFHGGTSYDIDQRVKALVQEGTSVYRVFADKLAELDPDVIVTQDQCEVCAASLA